MIQTKYTSCRIVARSINPTLKFPQQNNNIHTSEISILDFTNINHQYQRKKKRCPLFLMNKSPKKKIQDSNSIFTSQGIRIESRIAHQPVVAVNQPRKISMSKPKSLLNANKRRYSNPSRQASPTLVNSRQNLLDFPVFYFYPKQRCLQSALSNRQTTKIKINKSGRSIAPKQKLKSEGNQAAVKQLGAWFTKDIEFEQVL